MAGQAKFVCKVDHHINYSLTRFDEVREVVDNKAGTVNASLLTNFLKGT